MPGVDYEESFLDQIVDVHFPTSSSSIISGGFGFASEVVVEDSFPEPGVLANLLPFFSFGTLNASFTCDAGTFSAFSEEANILDFTEINSPAKRKAIAKSTESFFILAAVQWRNNFQGVVGGSIAWFWKLGSFALKHPKQKSFFTDARIIFNIPKVITYTSPITMAHVGTQGLVTDWSLPDEGLDGGPFILPPS